MPIPPSAAPFFQEYDFDQLEVQAHAHLIMERILAYGNRVEVRWLAQTYGWEAVRAWIEQSGSARLPRSRYHLWCIVYMVTEKEPARGIWQH